MAATLNRILKKVEDLGEEYFVIHSEIKPYGPGTRRFILGKHTELPQKVKKLPNGKFTRSHGKQKYFNVPLPALEFGTTRTDRRVRSLFMKTANCTERK